MRRVVGAAVAVMLMVGIGGAQAQQSFSEVDPSKVFPNASGVAPPQQYGFTEKLGPLTFYSDRPTFQAAHPGLPLEDFTGTATSNGDIVACSPPLDSSTNDACFTTGSVIAGFALDVTIDGGGGQYVVLNNALGMPCVGVGPNSFADEADWDFSPAVDSDVERKGGITRIEVREAVDGTGDIFCDLEFGDPPVPVQLQSVDVE